MSRALPLVIYPDSRLNQRSEPVSSTQLQSDELKQLILDMEKTMEENNGVGLAAVQVGKMLRLTVIKTQDGILPLINPKIIWKSFFKEKGPEGCLSIPGVYGQVKRAKTIWVRSIDFDGQPLKFKATGFFARVVQHEIDHMDGVLFIDRTNEIDQGKDKLNKMSVQKKNDNPKS